MGTLNYFGTNLTEAGHYFWTLDEDILSRSRLSFSDLPFNPENLPISIKGIRNEKGKIDFHNVFGYSIIAIEGSCSDDRWGSHSIFWVAETITYEEMKKQLLNIPIFKKIIEQMSFEIKWK